RIGPSAHAGVALSFVGIVFVVLRGPKAVDFGTSTIAGDLTTLAAAAAWSAYTVGAAPLVRRYGALPVTATTMWVGGMWLVLVSVPAFAAQDWGAVSSMSWLALLYSGALAIALAYFIWYYSIRQLGSTRTAVYSNFIPLVAILIAWPSLGEVPTWLQVFGAAAIVGGTILVRMGRIESSLDTRWPPE
ncbi:MAG: DMT family transporter, partial [Gemmatimonadota bacterium]